MITIGIQKGITTTRRIKIQSKIQGMAEEEDKIIPNCDIMSEGTSKENRPLA